jgi:hypothetical protein
MKSHLNKFTVVELNGTIVLEALATLVKDSL